MENIMQVEGIHKKDRQKAHAEIQHLLAICGLPFEDITHEHLAGFGVVRDTGKVIGVVGVEPNGDVGLLRSLAVATEHRGVGLGQTLTVWAEQFSKLSGIFELFLLTTTARGFFARQGYVPIGRNLVPDAIQQTKEFKSLCPNTAVCMHKLLDVDLVARMQEN